MKAVRWEGGDQKMPPKVQLPKASIDILSEWVKSGAAFPESAANVAKPNPADHWAFKPVVKPAPPAVKGNTPTAIDRFVLAPLEAQGLTLSKPAPKRDLIRRAHLVLTGLPPTAGRGRGVRARRLARRLRQGGRIGC